MFKKRNVAIVYYGPVYLSSKSNFFAKKGNLEPL